MLVIFPFSSFFVLVFDFIFLGNLILLIIFFFIIFFLKEVFCHFNASGMSQLKVIALEVDPGTASGKGYFAIIDEGFHLWAAVVKSLFWMLQRF